MRTFQMMSIVFIVLLAIVITLFSSAPYVSSIISIFPPLISIGAAFILRQVIIALFMGVWFGAWALNGGDFSAALYGLVDVSNKYAVNALVNVDHMLIIMASLFIGGLMGVITANGSMQSVVNLILNKTKNVKQVQLATVGMGVIIFFDDYANSLITGNAMRPVTDRMKVSREKLAYIVDSTAAPIASVAVISLWIGYLVSLIESSIVSIDALTQPYAIFIESLAYSFYPFLAVIFVVMVIISAKDFGPMLEAERRAAAGDVKGNAPYKDFVIDKNLVQAPAFIAIFPIVVLISTVILGILLTGSGDSLQEIIGSSNSLAALTLGGFFSSIIAISFTLLGKTLTISQVIESWISGVNTVTGAVIVLVLSWSLAAVTTEMGSAQYLISMLGDSFSPVILPSIVFILSGVIALGTGTSWGAMAILMPLVIPLSWSLISISGANIESIDIHILYASIAAVLAGAVWGDHCSPISDTTILSSLASQCDHVDHVRTQMPYAILVGSVGVLFGTIPAGFGVPWWLCFIACILTLWLALKVLGKRL